MAKPVKVDAILIEWKFNLLKMETATAGKPRRGFK
jgi:hypothetical protein